MKIKFTICLVFLMLHLIGVSQQKLAFANPFGNSKILLFSDSNDFILTQNEKIFFHNSKKKKNLPIVFNYDSILKVCYHKVYGINFDSAWKIRAAANRRNIEISVYGYKATPIEKYFFCRFFTVSLDTTYKNQIIRTPCILVLKTDLHFNLVDMYCTSRPYIKGVLSINTILNSEVYFNSYGNVLLPLYHPGYTSIKDRKYLNTDMDECIGEFALKKGSLILLRTIKINRTFNISKSVNDFKSIDNVFMNENRLFAFDSKIPIIYDVENNANINLYVMDLDSLSLLMNIENDSYEIFKCIYVDSSINIVIRIDDSISILKYNFRSKIFTQKETNIPINHIPLFLTQNLYVYGLISKEEIKIIGFPLD